MLTFLFALLYHPVLEPVWSNAAHFPEELLKGPELPYYIPADKLKIQVEYYNRLTDPEARRKILVTLRSSGSNDVLPHLLSLLKKENNVQLQGDILSVMLQIADAHGCANISVDPVFKTLLDSPSDAVRAGAAAFLILKGEKSNSLTSALEKETSNTVVQIVFARMAQHNRYLPLEDLRSLIQKTKNPSLRYYALEMLAACSPAADREDLLRNEKDRRGQLAIIAGLGKNSRMPDALLKEFSKSTDAGMRLALASIRPGSKARITILKKLLSAKEAIIRRQAVMSLQYAASSASLIEAVVPSMSASDRTVRTAAGKTLAVLTPAKLPDSVLAKKTDPLAHLPLLEIIRSKNNKEYAKVAAEILTYTSPDKIPEEVQVSAIETLSLLKNQQSAPVILQFANSKYASVRCRVAEGLRFFPGSATQQALKKLLADRDEKTGIKALDSVRYLKCASLAPDVSRALRNFKHGTSYRAAAMRALSAFPGKLTAEGVSNLKRLIFTQCISAGGGAPPMYEQGEARALGVYLLMLSGKAGNVNAQKLFEDAVKKFRDPFTVTSSDTLDEFNDLNTLRLLRQVYQIRDGKKLEKVPYELPEPDYNFYPVK